MSDGEQAKGQVAEARRFAKKYGLSNITVVIDLNGIQISGTTDMVMPVNIVEDYLADGWDVIEVDGHDMSEIYGALRKARVSANPTCIAARTVIGHGIPFMEGKAEYHGKVLSQKRNGRSFCHSRHRGQNGPFPGKVEGAMGVAADNE